MISQEEWMDLLSYRSSAASGVTWAEIARLAGCDRRTARKYLTKERLRLARRSVVSIDSVSEPG